MGDGVESMLLPEDRDEFESKRNRGGELVSLEEKEEVRLYCACLSRLGRSCLGDFICGRLLGDEGRRGI